jgi:anti-anti-sigma factor
MRYWRGKGKYLMMKQAWLETLQIAMDEVHGYPIIRLEGECEARGAQTLEETFSRLMRQGHRQLVLDTRQVRFLDQECFAAIERLADKLQEADGHLVVVDQSPPVERALKLLNVGSVAHVVPSLGQAAAYLDWQD